MQIYKITASLLSFFGYFSIKNLFAIRDYYNCDHTVDYPVDGLKSCFNYFPPALFITTGLPPNLGATASRNNIALSFEDIKHKESLCQNFLDKVGGGTQNTKHLTLTE